MDYYIRKSDEVASHQRNVEIRPLSSYFPFLPIYTLNFLLSEVAKNQRSEEFFSSLRFLSEKNRQSESWESQLSKNFKFINQSARWRW